jgi:LPXTG-motif cell wall-anchored protein
MDNFLDGVTGIVSTLTSAMANGITTLFNILVERGADNVITGPSVVGWFVLLGIGSALLASVYAFFRRVAKTR